MNIKNLGQIIKSRRESLGFTQEELASKIRAITKETFSRAALAQIESGQTKNPKPQNLLAACDVLGIEARAVLDGKLQTVDYIEAEYTRHIESNAEPVSIRSKAVPLISWISAGTWCGIDHQFSEHDALEYIHCPTGHSPLTYALTVTGVSMEPEFYENDIIIVDPCAQPIHKSFVVVRIGDKATFKQLIIEDNQYLLRPCNPDWPDKIIFLPDDAVICGVVVGKWKKY